MVRMICNYFYQIRIIHKITSFLLPGEYATINLYVYVAAPAVIIGIISAAYINGMWMDQFAEQVPLSWPVYILIALVILLLILACVIWKSWRIANENPVNSIKSE